MKTRAHDPLRLDVAAFTADGAALAGEWAAGELERLAQSQTPPQDAALAGVQWRARGETRSVASEAQSWLQLRLHTTVWLTCQRCLQPYGHALEVERWLRFVVDEAQAEALDAESEDDVLAMPRWLDLRELAEDELLLTLPIVPRHVACPEPLSLSSEASAAPVDDHPFAVLKRLKPGEGNGPAGGRGSS
jgi:DUF177 domain-containing protein